MRRHSFRPRVDALQDRTLLSTFTVTNLDDEGVGSLRQAILEANANPGEDTVRFDGGLRGTIALESQILITDDLTIRGPGADRLAVSGGGTTRVFAVVPADLADDLFVVPTTDQLDAAPEVTISRLAIVDGKATDFPGVAPGSGIVLGGGLYNLGGTVELERVDLVGNTAGGTPGGIIAVGAAVANQFGGTLTVSRSHFEGNQSEGIIFGGSGAINSDIGPTADGGVTGLPVVDIDRSSFVGNTAQTLTGSIEGVPVLGQALGGAIFNLNGSLTITRSDFEGNQALGGPGTPGSTSGGPGGGGAVAAQGGSPFGRVGSQLVIRGSTFRGNEARGGDGNLAGLSGGIANGGAIGFPLESDAMLSGNTFHGNRAVGGDGGDDADGGIASGGGIAVFNDASLSLERNRFLGNIAEGGAGEGAGSGGDGRGGGLALINLQLAGVPPSTATVVSTGDLFLGNVARGGAGGGDGLGGGIFSEAGATLELRRALVFFNLAQGGDGGVGLGGGVYNQGQLSLVRSRITFNDASDDGDDLFDDPQP